MLKNKKDFLRLPVVSHGAEFLVQGYLMRRNILTYIAPPNNEGYDLICIHPNPKVKSKQLRIQVKSRYATDCNRAFPVKEKSFEAFDYLTIVFLNIGYYYKKNKSSVEGRREIEFYTLPISLIKKYHDKKTSWEKVSLRGLDFDLEEYKNEKGFENIAKSLDIRYPCKHNKELIVS